MPEFKDRKDYDEKTRNKIFWKDECPLCDLTWTRDNILWKGKHWYIIRNIFPYSGEHQHLMAVPYRHITFSHELDQEEIAEIRTIHLFMKGFYGNRDYFSCTRETMANRSIEHLHIHFIPGKLQGKFIRKMLELQGFPIEEDLILS